MDYMEFPQTQKHHNRKTLIRDSTPQYLEGLLLTYFLKSIYLKLDTQWNSIIIIVFLILTIR